MAGIIKTIPNSGFNHNNRLYVEQSYSQITTLIDNNPTTCEYDFYDVGSSIRYIYVIFPNRLFVYYHRQALDGSESANVADWDNNYSSGSGVKFYHAKKIISNDGYELSITSAGEARTISAIPTQAPIGYNKIDRSISGYYASGNDDEDIYIITNGKEIEIVYFKAGSETNSDGSKTFLYYAPDGIINGNAEVIDFAYTNGSTSAPSGPGLKYTGDGTAAIILYVENLGGGGAEITGLWVGFEET